MRLASSCYNTAVIHILCEFIHRITHLLFFHNPFYPDLILLSDGMEPWSPEHLEGERRYPSELAVGFLTK